MARRLSIPYSAGAISRQRHVDNLNVLNGAQGISEMLTQLMAQGLLSVEAKHQTFVLTPESQPVLRSERRVMLRRDPERPARTRSRASRAPQAELAPEAATVFERLRAWRGATAKEQGVPAYVVVHDSTLREVAARAPASLADLGEISGVGENKLAKYGQGVLDAVAG